jgi:hypothetical protein
MAQKGFVPRINGCGEHVAMANMAINRAMTTGNILYMMALDMKDAFGSVSHKQLNNNLKSLGLCKPIREVIMDSYNGATDNIHIKRGVKQGCPLSPILFDICINPLIEKLNSTGLGGTPSADLPLRNKASAPVLGVWAPLSKGSNSQLPLILLLGINSITG